MFANKLARKGLRTVLDIKRRATRVTKEDFVSWLKNEVGANTTQVSSLVALVKFNADTEINQ